LVNFEERVFTPQKPAIILSIQDGQFRYLETALPDADTRVSKKSGNPIP